jgi:elongation factor 2
LIDSINQTIKSNDSLPGDFTVSPVKGTVVFTCGLKGWGFSLNHFADLYARKFGVDRHSLLKKLWGNYFYDSRHKKWTRHSKDPLTQQQQRGFNLLVLDPIYKILLLCNMDQVPTLLSKLNIQLMDDETMGMEKEALVKLMMRRFLPCSPKLLDAICRCLPSPITAQAYRRLGLPSNDDGPLLSQGIRDCNSNAPLVFYISQMIPRPNGGFYLFGRVFSGTVRRGEKVYIMGPNSYSGSSSRSLSIVKPVISIVRISCEGASLVEIDSCPAGHLVGLGGLDSWAAPHGTISSAKNGWTLIKAIKMSPPMVQVAVDVKEAGDLPKLVQGLSSLAKADIGVTTLSSLSGQHYIAGTGHFHLDLCLKSLENVYAKVPLKLGTPTVHYRETVTDRSSITCISKSSNKRNRLFMAAETMDEALSMAIEQDKITDFGDVRLRANHLADRYGWDMQHGRKIWCFGPDSLGANVVN